VRVRLPQASIVRTLWETRGVPDRAAGQKYLAFIQAPNEAPPPKLIHHNNASLRHNSSPTLKQSERIKPQPAPTRTTTNAIQSNQRQRKPTFESSPAAAVCDKTCRREQAKPPPSPSLSNCELSHITHPLARKPSAAVTTRKSCVILLDSRSCLLLFAKDGRGHLVGDRVCGGVAGLRPPDQWKREKRD
jgi:hypothetical protein